MVGGTVGTVLESRHPHYLPSEVMVGYGGWQEYFHSDSQGVERFDTSLAPMSTALGDLDMPGMTAYFGLLKIGKRSSKIMRPRNGCRSRHGGGQEQPSAGNDDRHGVAPAAFFHGRRQDLRSRPR
jgi:hypothetical protein